MTRIVVRHGPGTIVVLPKMAAKENPEFGFAIAYVKCLRQPQ